MIHPLGDHAQVSYVFDGKVIRNQQSKIFSTQFPANAIQSMEIITGSPDAEYGDKSSLIVNATTKSGLGVPHTFGSVDANWGSFGSWGENATVGFGSSKLCLDAAGDALALPGLNDPSQCGSRGFFVSSQR